MIADTDVDKINQLRAIDYVLQASGLKIPEEEQTKKNQGNLLNLNDSIIDSSDKVCWTN